MPSRFRPSPAQLLSVSIGGLILTGTILLTLPLAAPDGRSLSPVDALFTATSAVCVTGLIVVDTPTDLSLAGQLIVLALIQAGGLGYMAIASVIGAALGKRTTLQERLTLQEALNVHSMEGLIRFTLTVFKLTLAFEVAGAAVLALHWMDRFGPVRAAYYGLFHAVSAFNNAGFSLFSTNVMEFRGDVIVNLVVAALVICGGLGFVALTEIGRLRKGFRLSVHTKLVLAISAGLVAAGTGAILLLERSNPRTLGPLGAGEALLVSFFHSVVSRTAGFNTIDVGALTPPTLFLIMVLMFIGASPGSTGGGIKTTTFGVTLVALWATVRGRDEPSVFGRRLTPQLVARAFFLSLIAFLALNAVAGLVLVTERRDLLGTLFETTSAFGTVGLSTGHPGSPLSLSGHYSDAGKLLVALMMFMGRVGPLTLAVAVARGRARPRLRYPEGKVLIG